MARWRIPAMCCVNRPGGIIMGRTLLVVTHNRMLAARAAQHMDLRRGRVIAA